MRGFRPEFSGTRKHSLLLVNGRPAGATNLATIPLTNIERIEVLKGPASALYGSQAMGGVVNVITKKSEGKLRTSATIGGGSYKKWYAMANSGGAIENILDFDVSGRAEQQRDDNVLGDEKLSDNFTSFQNGVDRPNTTYKKYSGAMRVGKTFGDWRVDLSGDFFTGKDVETPGDEAYGTSKQGLKDIGRYGYNLSTQGKFISNNTLDASFFYTYDGSEGRYPDSGKNKYATYITVFGGSIQDTHTLFMGTDSLALTLGVDYSVEDIEGKSWKADGSRKAPYRANNGTKTLGIFTQGVVNLMEDMIVANAGVRYDYIKSEIKDTPYKKGFTVGDDTMTRLNPSFGLKVSPVEFLNVHSTFGTAFVAPNAYELSGESEYYTDDKNKKGKKFMTIGNPDVGPEKSYTVDFGVGATLKDLGLSADVTYYYTKIDDKIVKKIITETATLRRTTFVNANSAKMSGIESEVNFALGKFLEMKQTINIFGNYTYKIKSEKTVDDETTDVHNVADMRFTGGIEYDDNKMLSMRLSGRYVGHMKDTDWTDKNRPTIEYPTFWVMDYSVAVKIGEMHKVSVKLGNIFDKYYYEKKGFGMPGRTIYADYSLSF